MRTVATSLSIALAITVLACEPGTPGPGPWTLPADSGRVSGAEKWNSQNSPTVFSTTLEYKLANLPKEGAAERTPWPDTYWPTYEDSINVRWQVLHDYKSLSKDTLSPAEKYDLAFNGWSATDAFLKLKPYGDSNCSDKKWDNAYYDQLGPAAKWTAKNKGNWDAHNGSDDDGDGKTDECDDRDGVETWWGLCHAWVPAAILEPEPLKAVTENGVKFEVSDIKALLIAIYDPSSAKLVGGRCNDKEVKRDEKTGRILSDECRDVNPGTYHVIMANYLGKQKRAIAEDRTYDYQVWNQPIRSWKVDSIKEVTVAEAVKLLKLPSTTKKYTYNTTVKKLYEVRATTSYITESDASTEPHDQDVDSYTRTDSYHYILELDGYGKIVGGEWLDESHKNHPDFLWLPSSAQGSNPYIDEDKVRNLLAKSRSTAPDVPAGDVKSYESTTAVAIPDNVTAGVKSTITVPDDVTVGAKVEVEVDITHTYIGDLVVSIKHGSKTVKLHDKAGGSAHDLKKTFTTTDFGGASAKGAWDLVIADVAAQDSGKLNSWKLRIATAGTTPAGGTIKASATDVPKDIKDNDPAGVTSTINVTDSKTVKGVKATVKIEHTYVGALKLTLAHGGTSKVIQDVSEDAATTIDKTYDVTAFDGQSSSGAWTLNAADMDEYGDTGKITAWSLEIGY
jgi:subtilisin-like proprotein convertase family protein